MHSTPHSRYHKATAIGQFAAQELRARFSDLGTVCRSSLAFSRYPACMTPAYRLDSVTQCNSCSLLRDCSSAHLTKSADLYCCRSCGSTVAKTHIFSVDIMARTYLPREGALNKLCHVLHDASCVGTLRAGSRV